jgi:hypothetical protein
VRLVDSAIRYFSFILEAQLRHERFHILSSAASTISGNLRNLLKSEQVKDSLRFGSLSSVKANTTPTRHDAHYKKALQSFLEGEHLFWYLRQMPSASAPLQ